MKATLLLFLFATACTSSSAPAAPPGTATSTMQHKPPSADRTSVNVNVTLSGSRPMADVVRDLEQRGLVVEQRFEAIDVVYGHVPQDGMAALQGVSGVTAVELDVPIQLAPEGQPQ